MDIWVIINPQARRFFRPPAGSSCRCLVSQEPGVALAWAREAVAAGARQVIAVGGDGTVNEVINALANTEVILGIVPTGGANDLARELGLPRQPGKAWQVALKGAIRRLDLIQVQDRFLATGGGLGIGSQIVQRVNAWRRRPGGQWLYRLAGGQIYALAALTALWQPLRTVTCHWDLGFTAGDGELWGVFISNQPKLGRRFQLHPGARPDDGYFDLCFLGRVVNRRRRFAIAWQSLWGRHGRRPEVWLSRAQALRLEGEGPWEFLADGELWQLMPPLIIKSAPGALRVRVPR